MKAKMFADHEESVKFRESLPASLIIRAETEAVCRGQETLLLKECEQVERTRQRLSAERARIISTGFVPSRVNPTTTIPLSGAGLTATVFANNAMNPRQQVISMPMQTNIAGYVNNQPSHPHMSFIPRQPMFPFGPRLPLSAIHPSTSTASAPVMFNSAPNTTTPNLGHPLLRPVSGTNTNVG
ncbi:hypothetical protein Scep_002667 [Stephania cephalantha]|uniref:Uncharacterized protein n=1 Tax=Stephania cephalantha TaxID=152367 RepID=A0AAP0LAM5_9MAGN